MHPSALRSRRNPLLVACLFAASSAFAQSTDTPADAAPSGPASSATTTDATGAVVNKMASVEVTGSRIRTLNAEVTPLPVFSLPQVELERRGVERLADIRWAIPELGGSVGFNDNLINGGTSRAQQVGTSFNLRGVGGNSTLVLVDGRRIPHTGQEAPGGAGGREDFSVDGIPVSAIERIDILPEGAGAVYGSEAIAGVINIVLKKNFNGAELRVSYDNTFDSDVADTTVSLTAGHRSGKLSTFFTVSYEKQNGLASRDRWFTSTYDSRVWGSTSTSFLFNVTGGTGSLSSTSSPFNANQAKLPGLTTNVVAIPSGSNGSTSANGAYAAATPVALFDPAAYTMSIDPAKRRNVVANVTYELQPWAQVYADGRWSRFDNDYVGSPLTLSVSLPVGYPGNPFPAPVYLRKVFYDLPAPHTKSTQENSGFDAGVRGNFLETWHYDVSADWARNVVSDDAIAAGSFNFGLLSAAMASANKPLLAYDSANGVDPNAPGVLAALLPVADHKDTTDNYQYLASADGSVWSGWAGDVKTAIGAELDEEKVKFWREPSPATPTYVLSKPFSRRMTAAFGELSVPLLSDRQHLPLVHRLEAGGAVRASDYSDVGSTVTSSYHGLYQPVKWLTFRASRADGFKPVRLYDLQAPITTFTTNLTATSNVHDPLRGNEPVLGSYTYKSGGNPTLNPETSVSKNAGVVIDIPGAWFKGLSFSVDYYQIDYNNRSGSTSLQNLLNFFPERISRAAPTAADTAAGFPGVVSGWDSSNINLSSVRTKGWDYRVRYEHHFGFGELALNAALSEPDPIFTKATPGATPSSTFGYQPKRGSGSLFWSQGPWTAGVAVNYQAKYYINGLSVAAYPSNIEWNPQVAYNFAENHRFNTGASEWWARWLAGTKVSVTVVNVFNHGPSLWDAANGRVVMDPRLRRYILTASKKF
jgi:outer membrane receptor protein involved in Fe transport